MDIHHLTRCHAPDLVDQEESLHHDHSDGLTSGCLITLVPLAVGCCLLLLLLLLLFGVVGDATCGGCC